MPELPEVEVVRKSLNRKIKNKEIKKVLVKNKNLRFKVPSDFKNFLKNKKVINVNMKFDYFFVLQLIPIILLFLLADEPLTSARK